MGTGEIVLLIGALIVTLLGGYGAGYQRGWRKGMAAMKRIKENW